MSKRNHKKKLPGNLSLGEKHAEMLREKVAGKKEKKAHQHQGGETRAELSARGAAFDRALKGSKGCAGGL